MSTFERINRLGTRLDIFDLAVARYYPLGIRLNDLKKKLEAEPELKEMLTGKRRTVGPEAVLKVMALAKGTEPKNNKLLKLVNVGANHDHAQAEFYKRWDDARRHLQKAMERLREVYGAVRLRAQKNLIQTVPYTSIAVTAGLRASGS